MSWEICLYNWGALNVSDQPINEQDMYPPWCGQVMLWGEVARFDKSHIAIFRDIGRQIFHYSLHMTYKYILITLFVLSSPFTNATFPFLPCSYRDQLPRLSSEFYTTCHCRLRNGPRSRLDWRLNRPFRPCVAIRILRCNSSRQSDCSKIPRDFIWKIQIVRLPRGTRPE